MTPANPSITKGATEQFTATGACSDSSTANITSQVTWASGTAADATITSGGLATGVAAGSSTMTADLGAMSGNTKLTVTAPTAGVSQVHWLAHLCEFGLADLGRFPSTRPPAPSPR